MKGSKRFFTIIVGLLVLSGLGLVGFLVYQIIQNQTPDINTNIAAGNCGNNRCDAGETALTCSVDCGNFNTVSDTTTNIQANLGGVLRSITDSRLQYNLTYKTTQSTSNPLSDLKITVSPKEPTLGADSVATSLELSPSTKPFYNSQTGSWEYQFIWEDVSELTPIVTTDLVDLKLKSSAIGTINAPLTCANCGTFRLVSEEIPNESLFTIVKSSVQTCTQGSSTVLEYSIDVRNIGAQSGKLDFLEDNLSSTLISNNIKPQQVSDGGVLTNNVIRWSGNDELLTFDADEVKSFTYNITIPQNLITIFSSGILNSASIQYSQGDVSGNSYTFNHRASPICQEQATPTPTATPTATVAPTTTPIATVIPDTALTDEDLTLVIFGFMLIFAGIIVYRYKLGESLSIKVVSTFSSKVENALPFEKKIEVKSSKKGKSH